MILDIKSIDTFYGLGHILHGLSLGVAEGEVVALLGRNGAGKTTTLRSVTGLTPPKKGEILYKGRNIAGLDAHKICRMGIALVPETRGIFSYLTTRENLAIARALMTGPELLLLDEPSQGLAPLVVNAVIDTIRELKNQHVSMLLVEQNAELALQLADRVYVIDHGTVVFEGTPEKLRADQQVTATYLGVGG